MHVCICIYIYIHTHTYIYLYVYIDIRDLYLVLPCPQSWGQLSQLVSVQHLLWGATSWHFKCKPVQTQSLGG